MNADIENLIAKDQISDLNSRYCRALDWLDEEALCAVFWPDAPVDYGFFQGSAEAFVPLVMAMEKRAARRWHTTFNLIISVSGDSAQCESYGISHGYTERKDAVDRFYGGRYLDECLRRDGEWRISKRTYILDWVSESSVPFHQFTEGKRPLNHLSILSSNHPDYRPLG